MAAEKARLRGVFRARRASMAPEARARESAAIGAHLGAWLAAGGLDRAGATVSAFWPLAGEPDLRPLLRALRAKGVRVALPAVASAPGEAPRLEHRLYTGDAALTPGRFGVMEPLARSPLVAPEAVGVALVPALAVDAGGGRLGYGGGFYDAFLAETAALRVGVVWASAVAGTLPAESHDARLDAVCSPGGVRACGASPLAAGASAPEAPA